MFSGIVSQIGTIIKAQQRGDLELTIACGWPPESFRIGESIACNGACLTVVDRGTWNAEREEKNTCHIPRSTFHESYFTVTLSAETVLRTASRWQEGQKINLERSLRLGDTLDGHLVTGHVDGLVKLISITPPPVGGRLGGAQLHSIGAELPPPQPSPCGGGSISRILQLEAPPSLTHFIAEKGSVTLDGVSLTVNKVDKSCFWVNIIPHTWNATTLGERHAGDTLNMEIDIIARYMARLMQT